MSIAHELPPQSVSSCISPCDLYNEFTQTGGNPLSRHVSLERFTWMAALNRLCKIYNMSEAC